MCPRADRDPLRERAHAVIYGEHRSRYRGGRGVDGDDQHGESH
jgi:hypothetical protein